MRIALGCPKTGSSTSLLKKKHSFGGPDSLAFWNSNLSFSKKVVFPARHLFQSRGFKSGSSHPRRASELSRLRAE
jgi:hypothetical protein